MINTYNVVSYAGSFNPTVWYGTTIAGGIIISHDDDHSSRVGTLILLMSEGQQPMAMNDLLQRSTDFISPTKRQRE